MINDLSKTKEYHLYYKCRACKRVFTSGLTHQSTNPEYLAAVVGDELATHSCETYGEGSYGIAEFVGVGLTKDPIVSD